MELLSDVFPYLIFGAMGATVVVLGVGVIAMLRGGAFNAKHSNRLMRLRVILQAAALALFALFFLLFKAPG